MITPIRVAFLLLTSAAVFGALQAQDATPPKVDFPSASPACTLKQRVGLTDIQIDYSRPSMKGRKVFGGLEPYGKVWRTGANSATKITFSTPVKLNGSEVAAGTYELFTIPGEQEWTVIIHKNASEWGAYSYDAKDDVLRVKAAAASLAEPLETFTIEFNDVRDESATLNIMWEKTRVPVTLSVDVVSKVAPQIEAVMAAPGGKKPYFQAGMFYFEHNLDLHKALTWVDAAIQAEPNAFYYYYHKARIQAKLGDKAGAVATARKSIELAAAAKNPALQDEYTRLNEALIASLQ